MRRFFLFLGSGILAAGVTVAAPAGPPRALAGVQPGLWEFSRNAVGRDSRRGCLNDMVLFATYAHAGDRCMRTILSDGPRELVVALDCGTGDFGRSRITVTTPRSLKLETQGFHRGEPYDFSVYARRVGECPISRGR